MRKYVLDKLQNPKIGGKSLSANWNKSFGDKVTRMATGFQSTHGMSVTNMKWCRDVLLGGGNGWRNPIIVENAT